MIRKIVGSKDPVLRKLSRPVAKIDRKILNLIRDLTDTLAQQKDPEGVGLAAPQVGVNLRLFVMAKGKEIVPVINPEIIEISKKQTTKKKKGHSILEGCLSLPNYYTPLKRAGSVKLKYTTPQGEQKTEEFTGFAAQIVQHEVDHLNGIMFIDRLLEQKKPLYQMESGEWIEVELT